MAKLKNLNLNVNKPNIHKKKPRQVRTSSLYSIVSMHPTQKLEHLMEDISGPSTFGAYLEYTL